MLKFLKPNFCVAGTMHSIKKTVFSHVRANAAQGKRMAMHLSLTYPL